MISLHTFLVNKAKYLIAIIAFSMFVSLFSQNTVTSNYLVENINVEKIKEKENFYKNLFNPKPKLKKAVLISSGVFGTLYLSYVIGSKISKSRKISKIKDISSDTSEENISNQAESAERKSYTDRRNRSEPNATFSNGLRKGISKGLRKGIKNSINTFISLGVLYVISDILSPVKKSILNFLRSSDQEHFKRTILNLSTSLQQLQSLFTLENGESYKEEIVDHYNFFIENVENFLAIVSAISQRRIKTTSSYQSIKNEQNLMYKNIYSFSTDLNKILNESKNDFFDKTMSDQIWENFKRINNQIFRFINLSNAVIYEN